MDSSAKPLGAITSIILNNYPFYMSSLENLQDNWNIVEDYINVNLTKQVYYDCLAIPPIFDLFIPYGTSWNTRLDLKDYINDNFEALKNMFLVNLKTLFAKTNKTLLKIVQTYPENVRKDVFAMFLENTTTKNVLTKNTPEDVIDSLSKYPENHIPFLMMTSARANIWKDMNVPVPYVSKNDSQVFNQQFNNYLYAAIFLANSMFQYYGDTTKDAGKCFEISDFKNVSLGVWDRKSFTEPFNGNIQATLSTTSKKREYKTSDMKMSKYSYQYEYIGALLLNAQDPFNVDFSLAPLISASYYSLQDFVTYCEEYQHVVDTPWKTFADVLIGFAENDTFTSQTFKKIVYNGVMRKICNWSLFIPLNTFFDCSNINKAHINKGISIMPSQLANYKTSVEIPQTVIKYDSLQKDIEDVYDRATQKNPVDRVLKINCLQMSNPPTQEELARYNQIISQK